MEIAFCETRWSVYDQIYQRHGFFRQLAQRTSLKSTLECWKYNVSEQINVWRSKHAIRFDQYRLPRRHLKYTFNKPMLLSRNFAEQVGKKEMHLINFVLHTSSGLTISWSTCTLYMFLYLFFAIIEGWIVLICPPFDILWEVLVSWTGWLSKSHRHQRFVCFSGFFIPLRLTLAVPWFLTLIFAVKIPVSDYHQIALKNFIFISC